MPTSALSVWITLLPVVLIKTENIQIYDMPECYIAYNYCFIKFLKLQKCEVRITSAKSKKNRAKSKKLDEDAMLCNTLWSDRRRLITKTFPAFLRSFLNIGIDPNFPTKKFFFLLWFLFRENFAFQKTF